jgi:hypothetical protein
MLSEDLPQGILIADISLDKQRRNSGYFGDPLKGQR